MIYFLLNCNVGLPRWPVQESSIPGSERSPGEGTRKPPQYSCLENSKDRGVWWATVHGVTESDMIKHNSNVIIHYCDRPNKDMYNM